VLFSRAGGKYKERDSGFIEIESVPFAIVKIAEEDTFKKELWRDY
jgi:hypothetical protein